VNVRSLLRAFAGLVLVTVTVVLSAGWVGSSVRSDLAGTDTVDSPAQELALAPAPPSEPNGNDSHSLPSPAGDPAEDDDDDALDPGDVENSAALVPVTVAHTTDDSTEGAFLSVIRPCRGHAVGMEHPPRG
jgi:hypothetical protein